MPSDPARVDPASADPYRRNRGTRGFAELAEPLNEIWTKLDLRGYFDIAPTAPPLATQRLARDPGRTP